MDQPQPGDRSALADAEWARSAASTDVRRLLRQARRRRIWRWLVATVTVIAVGAVVVLIWQVSSTRSAKKSTPDGNVPVADAVRDVRFDPLTPFAATPAADWPDGADGIRLPAVGPVGEVGADRVAEATGQVRDVIIASRLDPRMLVDHDPTIFLGMLAPDARRQLRPLFGTGREAQAQALVSLVADGSRLLPAAPKVNGRMSARAGGAGELVVHTDYVFVYAFDTPEPAKVVDVMDVVVVVRSQVDYVLRFGPRWAPGSRGWWYGHTSGYGYSIACAAYRAGYLAPAVAERALATVAARQDRRAFFDLDQPPPVSGGCPR